MAQRATKSGDLLYIVSGSPDSGVPQTWVCMPALCSPALGPAASPASLRGPFPRLHCDVRRRGDPGRDQVALAWSLVGALEE